MKLLKQNTRLILLISLILFSNIVFGDGGASVPCTDTIEYDEQIATFRKLKFSLVSYKIDGKELPLSTNLKVLYDNNTDWVGIDEIKSFSTINSKVNDDNTDIVFFEIMNSQRSIYKTFER